LKGLALKALLAWHDRPFRKTRNIEEIGEVCLAVDPSLRDLVDRAALLTESRRVPSSSHSPSCGRAAVGQHLAIGFRYDPCQ
jgi:hypothetical protein